MSAGLDTEVKGDPASVERAATWLRATVGPQVENAATALSSVRRDAEGDWGGEAGPAFASQMAKGFTKADELDTQLKSEARHYETFASRLREAQNDMADVRNLASGAGLTVAGYTIQNPGPGPARPPDLTGPVTPQELESHNNVVRAYNAHQDLIRAWNRAVTDAGHARDDHERACNELEADAVALAILSFSDIGGRAAAKALDVKNVRILRQTAKTFENEYQDVRGRMSETDYREYGEKAKDAYGRDADHLDRARTLSQDAGAAADDAEALNKFEGLGKGVSGALLGLGIAWDIHSGESAPEAVTTDVGGYAVGDVVGTFATIGADAAVGAAMGSEVPVVGNVVGGVVGAGVGIFTTGALKSLWEGSSLGDAGQAGLDMLKDTGGAIATAGNDVGSGIGHAASAVGDFFGL
ncbi:MAG: hypothetical protein ACRDPH_04045 [Marmoricola sp.]